jgi:hypothetical protein
MVLATLGALTELTEKPVVSLIIPTYNESQNIPELFARVESSLAYLSFELIVVMTIVPMGRQMLLKA